MAEDDVNDEPASQESGEFDEDDSHVESHDEKKTDFDEGKRTADVYSEEGRSQLAEDDEITPAEEGFSKGAEEEFLAVCAHCGKVLPNREGVIEKKSGEHTYWFCTDKCAAKGKSVR